MIPNDVTSVNTYISNTPAVYLFCIQPLHPLFTGFSFYPLRLILGGGG
jgi:hypothetical protein